ncbi:hypothetical protein Tco_1222164, partial [Tanacetum coccineum]
EAKTTQAKEIASLKKRVKQLEKIKKLRTSRLKRLRKVGSASRVESSYDVSLEVTLIDETQERNDEEMKKHMEIVQDDEVAIDAIPLATKPPMIVEYKIDKEGKMGYFKLIRADRSSKRYSSMIQML